MTNAWRAGQTHLVPLTHRVLHPHPLGSLDDYRKAHGGEGLEAARGMDATAIIDRLDAAGLRGRGGAGFPTARKWRTVRDYCSTFERASVVVNAAEGEPGTLKDRTIMRNNPYQVIEGALIGALAVGADQVVVATKAAFATEVERLERAITEIHAAGWAPGVEIEIFQGPEEYLYGEETALLEAIDGRYPFPRTSPPWRRGVREVVMADADLGTDSGSAAHVEMATRDHESPAPPALVENLETLANVGRILAHGAEWFRTVGTEQSPGTLVCTITGATRRAAVGEVAMGTPLREVIEMIGGGAREGRRIVAVLPGVSNPLLPADRLDTPLTYEDMAAAGSGLGSGGYIVFDDHDDLVAITAGVSRFLAVESCGQCSPCKISGLAIANTARGAEPVVGDGARPRRDARPARGRHRRRALLPRDPATGCREQLAREVPGGRRRASRRRREGGARRDRRTARHRRRRGPDRHSPRGQAA